MAKVRLHRAVLACALIVVLLGAPAAAVAGIDQTRMDDAGGVEAIDGANATHSGEQNKSVETSGDDEHADTSNANTSPKGTSPATEATHESTKRPTAHSTVTATKRAVEDPSSQSTGREYTTVRSVTTRDDSGPPETRTVPDPAESPVEKRTNVSASEGKQSASTGKVLDTVGNASDQSSDTATRREVSKDDRRPTVAGVNQTPTNGEQSVPTTATGAGDRDEKETGNTDNETVGSERSSGVTVTAEDTSTTTRNQPTSTRERSDGATTVVTETDTVTEESAGVQSADVQHSPSSSTSSDDTHHTNKTTNSRRNTTRPRDEGTTVSTDSVDEIALGRNHTGDNTTARLGPNRPPAVYHSVTDDSSSAANPSPAANDSSIATDSSTDRYSTARTATASSAPAESDGEEPSGTGGIPPPPPPSEPAVAIGVTAVTGAAIVRYGASVGGTIGETTMVGSFSTIRSASTLARSTFVDRVVDPLSRLFVLFRYSRYDDSDPLAHEARASVFEVVEASPGVYLSKVSEETGLALSTVRHHLRVLDRENLVMGVKVRGKRRFYPAYSEQVELTAALNDEATASVLDALARLGPSSVSELATVIGRDPSTVTHHLQRLAEDDIVVREREGRTVVNRLSPDTRAALTDRDTGTTGDGDTGDAVASGAD